LKYGEARASEPAENPLLALLAKLAGSAEQGLNAVTPDMAYPAYSSEQGVHMGRGNPQLGSMFFGDTASLFDDMAHGFRGTSGSGQTLQLDPRWAAVPDAAGLGYAATAPARMLGKKAARSLQDAMTGDPDMGRREALKKIGAGTGLAAAVAAAPSVVAPALLKAVKEVGETAAPAAGRTVAREGAKAALKSTFGADALNVARLLSYLRSDKGLLDAFNKGSVNDYIKQSANPSSGTKLHPIGPDMADMVDRLGRDKINQIMDYDISLDDINSVDPKLPSGESFVAEMLKNSKDYTGELILELDNIDSPLSWSLLSDLADPAVDTSDMAKYIGQISESAGLTGEETKQIHKIFSDPDLVNKILKGNREGEFFSHGALRAY